MVNFNPIDYDYIARCQSDLENTKERPLYKPSQDQSKSTAMGGVWNFAERCILENFREIYEFASKCPRKYKQKLNSREKQGNLQYKKGQRGMRVNPPLWYALCSGAGGLESMQYAQGRYAVRKNPVISYADIKCYF